QGLLDEWDLQDVEYKKALERESRVDEVLARALNDGKTEPAWPAVQNRPGVELLRRVEPYESGVQDELVRSLWNHSSYDEKATIARAQAAVERAPRHVSDAAKETMTRLLDMDNRHAPLIARHMLLTGSPEYHEQFREYVASRGTYVGEALRAAM